MINKSQQSKSHAKRLCVLEAGLEELKGGQVRISDYAYPDVKIVIGAVIKPIMEISRYVTYYADGGEVLIRPLSNCSRNIL